MFRCYLVLLTYFYGQPIAVSPFEIAHRDCEAHRELDVLRDLLQGQLLLPDRAVVGMFENYVDRQELHQHVCPILAPLLVHQSQRQE